ncbi:MAG: DUF11 domain-containing protein [Candidatus Pacebacteria bacterium]|nr:DUF11 domain-containing protein [Candidatus Paceibacterota bacterium]MBP9701072.1 DUF11 domain-containing protein [Candidatus Paceibacterota bacterium]
MKKFITTILATTLGLAFFAPMVFAGGFNDSPQDLPTVMVANHTQNPCGGGPGAGCWTTSVSAQPGDTVSVRVYYHNTTDQTASSVSLGLGPKNNSASTSHTLTGGVAVGGMVVAQSSASVQLSSSATLNFIPGSVRWYPNQSITTSQTLLANESALFTNGTGLPIGNISPGWASQGSVVASFKVGGSTTTVGECYINSFDADDYTIEEGDDVELTWRTSDCDYVTVSTISGQLNPDDERIVSPDSTTTYTLRAYDNTGTLGDTKTLTITVDEPNNDVCEIDSFSASPSSIDRGDDSTLRWNTSGAVDYVTISNLSGQRNDDGSVSVSPYSTTTYTLRAYCDNGDTETRTVTLRVNAVDVSSAPQAITTVATILGNTQARLNGLAVPNTTRSTTAWFEWGVSGSFGNRTNTQTVTSGNSSQYYSDVVSGLVPGGVYYYRAVVRNENGTAYGDTVRFQTTRTTTIVTPSPRPIVQTVRNVVVAQSAPSLLELRVESNYDHMCVNGVMDYTITYRNISNQTLENTVLQFNHPKEITYLSASRGEYEVVDRTLTIDLGSVKPGEQGTITIHARVNDTAVRGNLTVATATVVYTNSQTHAQEDATAYSLITVSDDCPNLLGASAVGFGAFLPNTLLGWLLLILIILALIVLGRHLYKKKEQ